MRLAAIISIILIFLLIYRIGDLKKNTRGRYIYIAIFIGIIIVNGFILNDYVQVKSLHNYTTYITYQNLLNSIDDVNILKIEGISDVRVFSDSVDRLNSQIGLLSQQLDKSSLIKRSKKNIISNLDCLSLELKAFTDYQNAFFAREEEILDSSIPLYNEFKVKIAELLNTLKVKESRLGASLIGIAQYRLNPEKGQLDELDEIVDSISEINSRLMEL